MGQLAPLTDAADALMWACWCYTNILLMVFNRPAMSGEC